MGLDGSAFGRTIMLSVFSHEDFKMLHGMSYAKKRSSSKTL